MKKYILIFAVIMAASLIVSCSDNQDEPKQSGGETTININAGAAPDETTGSQELPAATDDIPGGAQTDAGTDVPPDDGTDGTDVPADGTTNVTPPDDGTDAPADDTTNDVQTDKVTEAPPQGGTSPVGEFTEGDLYVVYNGVKLAAGEDFLPNVDKIGTPRIEEGQACLGGGYDTNYYYGDELAVYTFASDGKQVIYDIYITDSGFATQKGAAIGKSTRDDIAALYGAPTVSRPASDEYQLDGDPTVVIFTYSGGVLESIDLLDSSRS